MAEYIRKDIAEKNIEETVLGASEFAVDIRNTALECIRRTPIADVREVVRGSWIKFELEYDEEEKEEILSCALPDDEEEILATDGKTVWTDIFLRDAGNECYLDSGFEFITNVTHWMPKPLPPSCGAEMEVE